MPYDDSIVAKRFDSNYVCEFLSSDEAGQFVEEGEYPRLNSVYCSDVEFNGRLSLGLQ